MSLFARNPVLDRLFSTHIEPLSRAEGLPAEAVRDHMEAGRNGHVAQCRPALKPKLPNWK